ncbi:MAG: Gfo/Idh/MocA family oxidoreductase [Sulfurimonas sp.]|nr:Gfo/Idh/MocA family oxidoreductase [Sulfurimonas sp.]
MKILIIGFGSIGKRHYEILNSFKNVNSVDIVTKQNIQNITLFKRLSDIDDLEKYDYFIISSQTVSHYEQLKYICSKVENKNILVEKPLYDRKYENITTTNQIFTAYNLRFNPVLIKLKSLLKDTDIYYANIICGQYLPTWRPTQDYKKSYSADIAQGGGVLRDLSHEVDYATWLFGNIKNIKYINSKVSDLEIKSDDIFTAIAVTSNKTIINLTMDYISKVAMRRLIVHTKNHTIEADMINNTLLLYDKDGKKEDIQIESYDRNYTYTKMHQAIINNDIENICSYEDGKNIVNIIENIEYKPSYKE